MLLKHPRLSYKSMLPLCIMIIISLMLVTMVGAYTKTQDISKQMLIASNEDSTNTNLLRIMTDISLNKHILLSEMILDKGAKTHEAFLVKFDTMNKDYENARKELFNGNLSEGQRFLFSKQGYFSKRNIPLEHEIFHLIQNEKHEEAKLVLYALSDTDRYQSIKNLEEISNLQFKIGQEKIAELKEKSNQAMFTVMMAGLTTLFVSILLTALLMRHQRIGREKLTHMATTDVLTGLPNRLTLINNIENTVNQTYIKPFALVFIDIDYFKSINDNYGHDVGDEILKQFTAKISESLHPEDTLSRFGGDEFVLLLKSITTKQQAIKIIEKLSRSLDTSFTINHLDIFTTSSIGATFMESNNKPISSKDLLSQADSAMYLAKKAGRNCYYIYSEDTHKSMQEEHVISHNLHSILKDNNKDKQLYLIFQPLHDLKTLKISGFEALIRWKNNEGKLIQPDKFIPIAEKTNLIEKINFLVIKEVCLQKVAWNNLGQNVGVRINFNLSGNAKTFNALIDEFKRQVCHYNLDYSNFGIELTERTILEVDKKTADEMKKLTDQGLKILIDDFGTGYSSLSYLKKLPVTTIKIDKSFISGLPENEDDQELVKTIITLGNSFKFDVIAEGVETEGQLNYLQDYACDSAQGYYLNKPLPISDINNFKASDYVPNHMH